MPNRHLIFTDLSGHRMHWLDLVLETFRDPDTIVLHFPESNTNSVVNFLSKMQKVVQVRFHPDAGFVRSVISDVARDDFLIDWDGDTRIIGYLFARKRIRLLIMRPYLQRRSIPSICRYLSKMLASYVLSQKQNIEIFFLAIPGHNPKIFKRNWVNDFVSTIDESILVREPLESPDTILREVLPDKYFLVPGFITRRKNPILILESVKDMNSSLKQNYGVVFAGTIEPSLEMEIASFSEAEVISRSLTENEIDSLIHHSAATILLYENVSSSGFALRCVSGYKTVILPNQKHWRHVAAQYPNYLKVSDLNATSLSKLLINLFPFKNSVGDHDLVKLLNQDIDVMSVLI